MRRWTAQLVIFAFLAVHAGVVARAVFADGKLPWSMFASRTSADRYLMATAIGPDGSRTLIPLEQIFRYARGATARRLYDNYQPITQDSDRTARARFARFLGGWLAARGVAVSAVELTWIVVDLERHALRAQVITTVPMAAGAP
jgi:hypothetical protein